MASKNVHTTYDAANKQWRNVREGASRASSVHDTKAAAAERGKDLARGSKGEWTGHNKDGRISEKNSYGKDDFPPRG